jgi:CRISPR-associated protein Csh2
MSEDTDTLQNRSEIVFVYDAEDTNPNGNPLSANDKPRVDETTGRAVVTDVRLKRYLRDQLDDDGMGIYIRNPSKGDYDDVPGRDELFKRVTALSEEELNEDGLDARDRFLKNAVDVRYFGATCSFSSEFQNKLGDEFPGQFIGPVQFSHARSLNRVVHKSEAKQLSTVVASSEGDEQGTFATDNRLQYAVVPFHGIVNEVGAESTDLTPEDVERLDTLCWRALKNQTLTRSKKGHQPRLYLRVEYSTDEFHIGTLDDDLSLEQDKQDTELRNITDVVLGVSDLLDALESHSEHIEAVHVKADRHLTVDTGGGEDRPDTLVGGLKEALDSDSVHEIEVYESGTD